MTHRLGFHPAEPFLAEWVTCTCGSRFQRPAGARYRECLGCQTASRLKAAGITGSDPAFKAIRDWNAGARRRAGIADDTNIARKAS